jgi:hypothetical protein
MARKSHPDRNIDSTEVERSSLSLQMAQVNGAYEVLSDPVQRREYDEKLRILGTLNGTSESRVTKPSTVTKAATVAGTRTKSQASQRVQPSQDSDLTLVQEFSKQLRSNLLANRKGFSWKEVPFEGFDWGLECASWTTHYCVAGRGFAVLDPAAAKKFANYSEVVVTRFNRTLRKSRFLFMLPFQHLSQWESVSVEFNRLFSSENRETRLEVPIGIILFDARRGRSMQVGGQLKEKHFEELLECLGPELMNSR